MNGFNWSFLAADEGGNEGSHFNQYGYEGQTNSLQNYPDASVEGGDEEEFIVLNPDDETPADDEQPTEEETQESQKDTRTDEEIEEAKRQFQQQQNQMADKLNQGFSSLNETLAKSFRQQNQQPANSQAQDPETWKKQFEEGLFQDGKTWDTFVQGVNQAVNPVLRQQNQYMVNQERELLRVSPDTQKTFNKYSSEVDDLVSQLPQDQQLTPGVYKWAHQQVVSRHVDDLQSEAVNETLKEKLEKIGYTLDENGDPVPKEGQKKSSQSQTFTASGGSGGTGAQAGGGNKKKTRRVRATQEDVQAAKAQGLSLSDYMQLKHS